MARPEILYLIHRFPYPPDKGDRIRAFNILKYLSQRANVWVGTFADEPVSREQRDYLRRFTHRLEIVDLGWLKRQWGAATSLVKGKSISEGTYASNRLRSVLKRWKRETDFQAVLFSASSMAGYLPLFDDSDMTKVVDLVDVDSDKWKQYANQSDSLKQFIYQREHRLVQQLEYDILDRADAVTVVSQQEADFFRERCRDNHTPQALIDKIQAVTNGVDLDFFAPKDVGRTNSICFLGAMDYRPNIDAVSWFADRVWPHLKQSFPDLSFNIVGRRPASEVNELGQQSGIHVTGAVEDVRPWLAQAKALVAPLRIARGVQNKVLEAMAMGRAVIGSPEALTGLNVQPGHDVLEAVTPDDWYYQIRKVLQSNSAREGLEEQARRYVERHHSWEATLKPLSRLLSEQERAVVNP